VCRVTRRNRAEDRARLSHPKIVALVGENSRPFCSVNNHLLSAPFRGRIWERRASADSFVLHTAPASVASIISPPKLAKFVTRLFLVLLKMAGVFAHAGTKCIAKSL
jgi:hypothetical protein